MYLVNTESIPGYRVRQSLGLVQGNTIRAKHIGRDIMAGFKNIVGGEIVGYTELLAEARNEATQRMIAQAQSMGANAIVNVRYSTASVMQAAAEMFAYGTAVIVEPENVG
ncbi:MAG: YbjQ family protein [Planctomycetes bacterium]|nr:YbjQ family protein [Planctomycetota bacterium]MCB9892824.1 YbjQ family protein [Planctomycetota bacterium]